MIRIIAMCLLLSVAGGSWAASSDKRAIDQAVTVLVRQFSDGIAVNYPEFRLVRFGRVLGGESDDAVAFFSIEGFGGGNDHAEYLAVFSAVADEQARGKKLPRFRLIAVSKIGGRGWRTFDWRSSVLKPGAIAISGKQWQENDPGCCASGAIDVVFAIQDERLVERP